MTIKLTEAMRAAALKMKPVLKNQDKLSKQILDLLKPVLRFIDTDPDDPGSSQFFAGSTSTGFTVRFASLDSSDFTPKEKQDYMRKLRRDQVPLHVIEKRHLYESFEINYNGLDTITIVYDGFGYNSIPPQDSVGVQGKTAEEIVVGIISALAKNGADHVGQQARGFLQLARQQKPEGPTVPAPR